MLRRAYCLSLLMSTAAVAPISYKLQNINLAERWLGLVRAGSVSATTEHGEAYGVAEVAGDLRFFVRGATEKARNINATLAASGDGLRVVAADRERPFRRVVRVGVDRVGGLASAACWLRADFGDAGVLDCRPPALGLSLIHI